MFRPAVLGICRAAEEVFDHANHFEHLASESEYFLGEWVKVRGVGRLLGGWCGAAGVGG